jgi:Poly(ADP-ribose) polymerase catalytic domain
MLICEVVLGKQKEGSYDSDVSPLGSFNSVKGVGQRGPDMKNAIYLPTGEMIPQLPVKDYRQSNNNYYGGGLSYNEYIVYDESQIRIKYLV